ncbi:hypothetical cytosolic protein [Syntrophus aciditrophicus SB]|uniref:Hypothetical cytosolic protein n=1 Tax=Syntrophus aciditrophicus (strain SB) TaxID=56780 RepID=Q2LUS4_SYNAS|nr:hypothetical cytosolic protein [Syntrophus aciditrophicus SB]
MINGQFKKDIMMGYYEILKPCSPFKIKKKHFVEEYEHGKLRGHDSGKNSGI